MKKKKSEKLVEFWRDFWVLIKPSRRQIKILFFLTLFFEGAKLISPYILKLIIDALTAFESSDLKPLLFLILLFFIASQFDSIIVYLRDKKMLKILIDMAYYLEIEAQKKLVFLSLSYHEKENTGNKITKIEKGLNNIDNLTGNLFFEVVPTLAQMFFTTIVLFIMDWRFGAAFLFFSPLFIYLTYKINRELRPLREKRFKNYEVSSGIMGQSIININAVKSFVQEKKEVNKFRKIKDIIRYNETKEWDKLLSFNIVRNLIIDAGRVAILIMSVYLVWRGEVTIGTLVFVLTLSEKSFFSLYRLSRFYDRIEEASEGVKRFVKLANEQTDIKNPENGLAPKTISGQIKFDQVSFVYSESKSKALDKVSFKINSSCVTALVGPSGGGKTTIARLIYRHYDPQEGNIYLDDNNLRDYDIYGFRKFIAIVPQEVEVFNDSIKNNISYAKPNASMSEIRAAARIANAEEFIDKLAKKYETEVGERGIKLSGGQRQRIGIARAILANPRILIFDEATSNLDSYSEKLIQEAMDKIIKGRTVIIIAHRLSTIKKADKIIVLENGRIAEQGSHYQLAHKKSGLYAKLLKLQEMGDIE